MYEFMQIAYTITHNTTQIQTKNDINCPNKVCLIMQQTETNGDWDI